MFKKTAALLMALTMLAACSSSNPRIVQSSSDMKDVTLTVGMATQIEMPDARMVQSAVVGNPDLVLVKKNDDVVSLIAKGDTGETNLIIRAIDDDKNVAVYQYRVVIPGKDAQ